jgi:hypothetical protein
LVLVLLLPLPPLLIRYYRGKKVELGWSAVVESLPCISKVMGSIPNTQKHKTYVEKIKVDQGKVFRVWLPHSPPSLGRSKGRGVNTPALNT